MGRKVLFTTSYLGMPRGRKLGLRWTGPFCVAARVGVVAYLLELSSYYKFYIVFPVSLLKSYNNSGDNRAEANPDAVVLEPGSNQEFEVEHILEYKYVGCNRAL